MKEIQFGQENGAYVFNFYFSHNAQVLLSVSSGVLIFVFSGLFMLKPYFALSTESFLLGAFFIALIIAMRIYKKHCWLTFRKRLEISPDAVRYFYADFPYKTLPLDSVEDISIKKEWILGFPFNAIVITGQKDAISIQGFKAGIDITKTHEKIKELISLQKSVTK